MLFVPGLFLCLAPSTWTSAVQDRPLGGDDWRARVESIAAGADAAAGARELAALGPRAIPALLDALAARPAPSPRDARDGKASDAPAEALLAALAQMPSAKLRTELDERIANDASVPLRVAVLRCLGRAGASRDLSLFVRAATTTQDERVEPEIERALVVALVELLARDRVACSAIEMSLAATPASLRVAFVEALGLRADADALRCLSRLLHLDAELRPRTLVEIGRAAAKTPRPVDEDVLANVRRYLAEVDSAELPEAILAAGHLDDCESIPQLVALLSSAHRGVRLNALWSLQQITGLGIRDTPDRWLAWYAAEKEWWTRVWPTVSDDLRGSDRKKIRMALTDIGPRHLDRHRLAEQVARVLELEDPEVQTLACTTLIQLGSLAAVPALINALEHEDPVVRASAWNALQRITGFDLPPEAARWRARIPGG